MKYKINLGLRGMRPISSFVIEADTIELLQILAAKELKKRNWDKGSCWAERIEVKNGK